MPGGTLPPCLWGLPAGVSQSGRHPHRWHPCASAAAPPGHCLLCLLLLGCPVGPQGQASERWSCCVQEEAPGLVGDIDQPELRAALQVPQQPQASLGDSLPPRPGDPLQPQLH